MKRLELLFWAVLPRAIALVLALFCLMPKPAAFAHFLPLLVVMPIYFWGLLSERDMPYWFVFALGLAVDAVQGGPLGFTSLVYVIFLLLVSLQRKYIVKEGFVPKWGYFALLLGAVSFGQWLAVGLMRSQLPQVIAPMMQYGVTVCLYPFFHRLFDLLFEQAKYRRRQIAHGR